ncbi:MAG: rhomboid family intramembrane serine protease [Anaerolineae bacterium]|nr:rhomboid family intramembrane serine protease [Anaerolineae bacterium]
MLPIGDEHHGAKGIPVVTLALIAVNALVYLYQISLNSQQLHDFIYDYGMIPAEAERGADLYTFLTSMFVHGGFAHIFGNMLFLWIFGDNIEQRFGHGVFFLFYVGTGLAAGAAHLVTNADSTIPTVGASGAISGVMGAYVLLYPRNRIRVIIGYFGMIYVPAFVFLGVWFLMQFMNGLAALSVETAQSSGVAFWAHIGGFAAGAAVAIVVGSIRKDPPRREASFAMWQDRDRRQ